MTQLKIMINKVLIIYLMGFLLRYLFVLHYLNYYFHQYYFNYYQKNNVNDVLLLIDKLKIKNK